MWKNKAAFNIIRYRYAGAYYNWRYQKNLYVKNSCKEKSFGWAGTWPHMWYLLSESRLTICNEAFHMCSLHKMCFKLWCTYVCIWLELSGIQCINVHETLCLIQYRMTAICGRSSSCWEQVALLRQFRICTVFLFWELCGLIHVSVSDLYIPRVGPHISSSRKGRPIVGIYNSLTDTWMWKLGLRPRYSFSGNICFKFSTFFLCSVHVNLLGVGWLGRSLLVQQAHCEFRESNLAKVHTLYWKSDFCIPSNETAWPLPNFYIHVSVVCLCGLQQYRQTILGIFKSLTNTIHECGNWETEHYNYVLE